MWRAAKNVVGLEQPGAGGGPEEALDLAGFAVRPEEGDAGAIPGAADESLEGSSFQADDEDPTVKAASDREILREVTALGQRDVRDPLRERFLTAELAAGSLGYRSGGWSWA